MAFGTGEEWFVALVSYIPTRILSEVMYFTGDDRTIYIVWGTSLIVS